MRVHLVYIEERGRTRNFDGVSPVQQLKAPNERRRLSETSVARDLGWTDLANEISLRGERVPEAAGRGRQDFQKPGIRTPTLDRALSAVSTRKNPGRDRPHAGMQDAVLIAQ